MGADVITPQSVAQIIQARAVAADFRRRDLGGHSLKRGVLITAMERGVHPAKLKRCGRHKSFDVLGEHLELGDLFDAAQRYAVERRGGDPVPAAAPLTVHLASPPTQGRIAARLLEAN